MDIKVVKHWYFSHMLSKTSIEKIIVPALGLEEIHLPVKTSERHIMKYTNGQT